MGLFGWLSGADKYGAAQSALIAKYMFSQMTQAERNDIRNKAIDVLQYGGFPRDYVRWKKMNRWKKMGSILSY